MWASWLDHSYYGSASHTEVGKVLVNSWPWSNKWRLWIQEQIAWRFSWGFTWCEQRIGWSVLYIFYLLYLTLDVISATNTSLWCFFTKTVCHRSYSCISIPIHWASSYSRKNILLYMPLFHHLTYFLSYWTHVTEWSTYHCKRCHTHLQLFFDINLNVTWPLVERVRNCEVGSMNAHYCWQMYFILSLGHKR